MKKFPLFIFTLAVFFFQFSILGVFFENRRAPNLFVALAVSMALYFGFEKSLAWTILAGFLLDVEPSWIFGSGILNLVLILWLIDKAKGFAEFRSKRYLFAFLIVLTAGLSSVFFDAFAFFFLKIEKIFFPSEIYLAHFPVFTKDYILKTTYTSLSAVAVYFFVRKFSQGTSGVLSLRKRS